MPRTADHEFSLLAGGPNEQAAVARAARLEWLLQAVLDVQALVANPDFDLDAFMQRVVDLAAQLTHADGSVVELAEGEDMVYRCTSSSVRRHLGLRLKREGSLSGLCVASAQVLRCDDAENDPRVDQCACREVGVRSMICTPLFGAGAPVGVLKVMSSEPAAFGTDEQYLLGLLAGALGAALARQLTLDALRTSEETFRTAMQIAPIGNALLRPSGEFFKVNSALCRLLGYSEDELLAKNFRSVTHPEDLARNDDLVQQALAGEIDGYELTKRYLHKSGRSVWTHLSVSLVRDRTGQPSFFVAQIQDITQQREMERVKGEFISIVSHELRTPLTSIRGSLGLVLGTHASILPPAAQRLLAIANNNCERLILLINDILDIDKIASGNMRFDIQEHGLGDIMFKAVQATESYAQRFNVRLSLELPGVNARVSVDEDRMLQVLVNLLSNAIKFSPADGVVEMAAQVANDHVRLLIRDRGPGIPEEFRDRIFERFSQADSSQTRRAGGTGLGLHISKQIVEYMHGAIGFESQTGQGTTFWVELPLTRSTENAIGSDRENDSAVSLPRILHVENDVDLAEVVRSSLHGIAHTVLATSLAKAQHRVASETFELVILDVGLPDGSGLDLLDDMERLESAKPPVILLCADSPPRSVQGRVAAVLVKTRVSERVIVQTIEKLLKQRRGGRGEGTQK